MAAFLEDITPFLGTGERNEAGLSLAEFLEEYDPNAYENPCSTADIVVIRTNGEIKEVERNLKVLMIKRRNHPGIGMWALPGGFAEIREDLSESARRELMEETSLTGVAVEQMYTWGEVFRDPRTRIITTSYLAIVDDTVNEIKAGDDAKDAAWMDLSLKKSKTQDVSDGKKERRVDTYELLLSNAGRQLELTSEVCVSYNKTGILKEVDYQVISSTGMAFDHPRFIVQALLYIKEHLA